jgi:ABC-2 type transport system permease protein
MVSYSTRSDDRPAASIAAAAILPIDDAPTPVFWRGASALAWREIIRFLRQRNRVVGAVGQPIIFWLLFGVGMHQNFQVPGQSFGLYFVPGTLVLILLFTAIFATISIIEDRQEGFLQAVLVAPLPRGSLVLGKVAGGSVLAVGQALIFLILSWTLGVRLAWTQWLAVLALMSLIAVGLTSLGFCLAWRLDSTQGFHAIMNLLLMPMWLLSGAFFPVPQIGEATHWSESALHFAMRCNPVTYSVAGLRQLMFGSGEGSSAATNLWLPSLAACWWVSLAFALATFLLAVQLARRTTQGDLR